MIEPGSSRSAAVGAVAAAVPLVLAFRGGGSDIVARQETAVVIFWGIALLVLFGAVPRARPHQRVRLVITTGAGLLALTAVSLAWGESAERGVAELNRVALYLGVLALVAVGVSSRSWRSAAAGLAIAALALPVLAVLSRIAPDALEVLGFDLFASRRLLYPLGYWNAVACWSGMALAFGVAYSAHLRPGPWRIAALAATPFAGTAVYLTYSRGGAIGAVVGLVVVIVLSRHRRTAAVHALVAVAACALAILIVRGQPEIANGTGDEGGDLVALVLLAGSVACGAVASRTGTHGPRGVRKLGGAVGALAAASVAAGVIVAIALGGAGAASRGGGLGGSEYPAASADPAERLTNLDSGRYDIWSSALSALASDPLLGVGAGGFEFWWNRDQGENESLRDAHSFPLEMAAELGIPGLILSIAFVASLAAAAGGGRARARSPGDAGAATALTAAFVVFLLVASVDWMWEMPALTILGLSAALVAGASRSKPFRPRSRMTLMRAVAALLALIAGMAQIPGIVSLQRVRASQTQVKLGDPEAAVEEAGEAIAAEPWAASPYAQRALAYVAAGDIDEARSDVEEAIRREPTNWKHLALRAQIDVAAGRVNAALASLEEARNLSPVDDEAFDALASQIESATPAAAE